MVKAAVVHKAAINMLTVNSHTGHIVTGSADKTVKCFDMRSGEGKNLNRVKLLKTPDSVLCGQLLDGGNLAMVGCSDGNLVAFDLSQGGKTGTILYGYGCDASGAINCLAATPDQRSMVVGGDSG